MSRPDKPSNQADQRAADSPQSAGSATDSAANVLAKLSESAGVGKQVRDTEKETREPPSATIGPDLRYDSVAAARQAIAFHEKKDASRSYLGTAISSLTSGDEKSLAELKRLTADYDKATSAGNTAAAAKIKQDLEQAVREDRKALERQDDITHYGSGFLKAAGLFMRGKGGLAGTAAAYALDQMSPNDPFKTQLLDGGLGVTKGLALKGIFHKLGQAEVGIAAKGVGLGVSSRFAELGLTRQTYMGLNGEYSGGVGLHRITAGMLSKEALITDVVVFGVAHNLVRGGNSLTGGAIDRSPLATTMLTAGSFGLLSGSSAEVHKQLTEGRSLTTMDYAGILKKGAIQGGIDLFAGAPGGLQARAALTPSVESIRQAGETRSVARQLASDTSTLQIGSARVAGDFFAKLGKALAPETSTSGKAELFNFLETRPGVQEGVKRFAELHPDQSVRSMLGDFFQRSAFEPARSPYQAVSDRTEPTQSGSGKDGRPERATEPVKEVEASYLTLDGKSKGPVEDIRREGPGVFSGSKEGEMWVYERDVSRIPYDLMKREISEVRSPLFVFEPLDALSRQILKTADRFQVDLAAKEKEIATAREQYVGTVEQVKERIISEDILTVNELHMSEVARQQLAGRPELLTTYEAYVKARETHAAKVAELEEAVRARAQQLQEDVNALTDQFGLPRVRLKAYEDLGGSGARYGVGSGEIKLRNQDLYNRTDTAGLVSKVLHELGHGIQDSIAIRHLADTLGIGQQPKPGEVGELIKLYRSRTNGGVDLKWLETVLRHRDGVRLDREDAAHAELLLDGFRDYESPTQTLIDTGNHFRMTKRTLLSLTDRNGAFLAVESLQLDKSGTLSEHLFGTKQLPAPIRELVRLKDRFERFETADWPELKIRAYLKGLFTQRLANLNSERREAFTKYMAGVNEREAWLIGARARVIAERHGGTTGDTSKPLSPDMEAVRLALESLSLH